MTHRAERSESRETIVEIFDVFAGVNERLTAPFDLGRIKVALICHFLFSEGHLCTGGSGCSNAVTKYYERVVPTGSDPVRAERIDRLFAGILRADEARGHIRRMDYRSH